MRRTETYVLNGVAKTISPAWYGIYSLCIFDYNNEANNGGRIFVRGPTSCFTLGNWNFGSNGASVFFSGASIVIASNSSSNSKAYFTYLGTW
jgi:hypothetical protein